MVKIGVDTLIEFKHVSKTIGSNVILKDIDLTIESGTLMVLIGPSGCGKTTTLKMINKLISPSSGTILIDGKDISKEDTIGLRRGIGYVIQSTGLFPHLTIKENIELIPKLKKEDKDSICKKTLDLLNLVGLDPEKYMDKYPRELSGGQQQRVGVARAFATDADIILMDEPFSALDPITRNSLQEELFSLQQELKKTIIFVTHDMDEAIKLGDKICIMHDGVIAQVDNPENILRKPANEFVKNFIGDNRVWDKPEFIKALDIMIKDPISIRAQRTIFQGINIMRSTKVDSLLIVDKEDTLIGIVTLKDITKQSHRNMMLQDIMEHNVFSVKADDNLLDILTMMKENSIGYVPVTDEAGKLVGLVTRSSLISVLSEQFLETGVTFLE